MIDPDRGRPGHRQGSATVRPRRPDHATPSTTASFPGSASSRDRSASIPEGPLAPQMLGFLGKDRDGLAGLEYYFDTELTGEPGQIETEADTTDKEIILARRIVQAAARRHRSGPDDRPLCSADARAGAGRGGPGEQGVRRPDHGHGASDRCDPWDGEPADVHRVRPDGVSSPATRRFTRPSASPTSTSPAR